MRGVGPERELDPLAGVPEVVERAVPDEPVLGVEAGPGRGAGWVRVSVTCRPVRAADTGVSGWVRRSMTVSVIWMPRARSRVMFRRNSRVVGSIRVRAAEISSTAVAASTLSWSNGKTNKVAGESWAGLSAGSTGDGRT